MGTSNENQAVLEAAKNFSSVEVHRIERGTKDQITVASVPQGRALQDLKPLLDKYLTAPERRRGTAVVTTVQSFVDLVLRFKDQDSAIFADNGPSPSLTAVLDYNPEEPSIEDDHGGKGAARFGEHRVLYQFPLSTEWQAWMRRQGADMPMGDFAQFLEDRIIDVLDPAEAGETCQAFAKQLDVKLATPQRLMELSRNLSIRVGQKATQSLNLTSGEGKVSFEEKHEGEAGETLTIPGAFVVAIPVFKNGPVWQIPVRLRYRLIPNSGQVVWTISLQRTEFLMEAVVTEACAAVKEQTQLPLFFGAPEK